MSLPGYSYQNCYICKQLSSCYNSLCNKCMELRMKFIWSGVGDDGVTKYGHKEHMDEKLIHCSDYKLSITYNVELKSYHWDHKNQTEYNHSKSTNELIIMYPLAKIFTNEDIVSGDLIDINNPKLFIYKKTNWHDHHGGKFSDCTYTISEARIIKKTTIIL